MKLRVLTIGLAVGLAVASPAQAWDHYGHMLVAALAYKQLNPQVRDRADALIKLNPMYAKWTQGVPAAQRGITAFVMAARWPDLIKADPAYHDDGLDEGETPDGPTSSQNIGYDDHFRHKYWHYKDIPFSPDGTDTAPAKDPNLETEVNTFASVISSDSASDDLKSYDLVWLLHLVGDAHQPLHATSRYTADLPKGDEGGNHVALCASPCKSELHAFWDDVLGTGTSPQAAIKAAGNSTTFSPPAADLASNLDPSVWLNESYEAAKKWAYVDPIGQSGGPFTLTQEYKDNAKKTAAERVALAGARLANLLNQDLK